MPAAHSNLIGTNGDGISDSLERNIISGNAANGVEITGTGTNSNVIAGNSIGTNISGTAALGNVNGVEVDSGATGNTIGGSGSDTGNLISGNTNNGVLFTSSGTANNVVAGNDIGTDVTGTKAVPNAIHGVAIYDGPHGNIIGTNGDGVADAQERNLISANGADGVAIAGFSIETDNNVVAGNYIGTDSSGTLPLGNQARGVEVLGLASLNRIGVNSGDVGARAEGNVISANQAFGVWIWHGAASNVVAGNLIGTNAAGTAPLANGAGVEIADGAHNNWIGVNPVYGPENTDQGNVIAGNSTNGVNIQDSGTTGNVVAGNLIGLNVNSQGQVIDGLGNGEFGAAVFNGESGVAIYSGASGNWVGVNPAGGSGTQNALERNVISGNYLGVAISGTGTTGNVVAGNLIGTDPTGTAAVPNQTYNAPASVGVVISLGASSNLVGTSGQDGAIADALERNVISGGTYGVLIYGQGFATTGNVVTGDYIGTTADGSASLGNTFGVSIAQGASNNWIGVNSVYGPETADERNVISGNADDGVEITDAGTSGNTVAGNDIGTTASGTSSIPNGSTFVIDPNGNDTNGGVLISSGASGNLIGTTGENGTNDSLERNVISGNGFTAVVIDGATTTGNVVAGDYLGTTPSGESPLGNGTFGDGVDLVSGAHGNWIGVNAAYGPETADQGNLISGNNSTFAVGVYIDATSAANVIAGNLIGTDASGAVSLPNAIALDILGPSNLIGTGGHHGAADVLERNVISASLQQGIVIAGAAAKGNVIAGNLIGTNASASAALGNTMDGISIQSSASNNTIGGTTAGAGNVISGNTNGVELSDASANLIQGNLIGLDQTGSRSLGNSAAGVLVDNGSSSNTIGGPVAGARNFISGNTEGVLITGTATTGTLIAANLIGTDVKGAVAVPNISAGIELTGGTATTIGGTTILARNLISGNDGEGLLVQNGATNTLIQGNYVGIDATGAKPLGNGGDGISIDAAPGTTIGGTAQGACNVISDNAQAGLSIQATAAIVLGNRIGTDNSATAPLGNGTFGILLTAASGVTIGGTSAGAEHHLGKHLRRRHRALDGNDRHPHPGQPDRHRRHRLKSSGQRDRRRAGRRFGKQHDRRHQSRLR